MKGPNKTLLFLARGLGKGQPGKTEHFLTRTDVLQPKTTERSVAPALLMPGKAKWRLGLPSSLNRREQGTPAPTIGDVRAGDWGAKTCILWAVKCPHAHAV